jgi:hypothetical protein
MQLNSDKNIKGKVHRDVTLLSRRKRKPLSWRRIYYKDSEELQELKNKKYQPDLRWN